MVKEKDHKVLSIPIDCLLNESPQYASLGLSYDGPRHVQS